MEVEIRAKIKAEQETEAKIQLEKAANERKVEEDIITTNIALECASTSLMQKQIGFLEKNIESTKRLIDYYQSVIKLDGAKLEALKFSD